MGGAEKGAKASDAFWTVANVFSLVRVVLVIPTVWLIWLGPDYRWHAFGLVLVMVVTDWLDGYFARRRGEITRWGKILDPLADKLAIDSIAVALVYVKGLPAWVAAVIVGRDAVIVMAGLFLIARERTVQSANIWGKLTSAVMTLLLLSYHLDWGALQQPLLALGVLALALSLASYGIRFFRMNRAFQSR